MRKWWWKRIAAVAVLLGVLAVGWFWVGPHWMRSCRSDTVMLDDATGILPDSVVRSRGMVVGYIKSIHISNSQLPGRQVRLEVCLDSHLHVLPTTRATTRSEGFEGERFVVVEPLGTSVG